MEDIGTRLASLKRPPLLSRAARAGIGHYVRKRDLRRILGQPAMTAPLSTGAILVQLLAREHSQDQARRNRAPSYSLVRHLETLIAIAAEGDRFFATRPKGAPQSGTDTKESGRPKTGTPDNTTINSDRYQRKLSGMDSFFCAT